MNELENLRERIDTIDKELIALFEERMNAIVKKKDYTDSAINFIKDIMEISKKFQQKIISKQQ